MKLNSTVKMKAVFNSSERMERRGVPYTFEFYGNEAVVVYGPNWSGSTGFEMHDRAIDVMQRARETSRLRNK